MKDSSRGEKPRVVYWFNQPTPYVVARFNAVADHDEVDLEAWFNEVRQADRSWQVDSSSWRFPARYIPLRSLFGLGLRAPLAELLRDPPDLFVCEYDRLNLAAGAAAARARREKGGLPSSAELRRVERPHLVARSSQASALSLDRRREGAWPRRCAVGLAVWRPRGPHQLSDAVDSAVSHFARATEVANDERDRRRRELNLQGCVFVFVGRLWSGKGLDELFTAYRRLSVAEKRDDISLLVIGDGVEEDRYKSIACSLPRVSCVGFVQPAELPQWYALADCLVLPTHGDPNGLVVEEAFAAGLPVICSDAAGDIHRRLPHGEAGFVFPMGSQTALSEYMRRLADDAHLRTSMAGRARELAAARTDEQYAADFNRFVRMMLEAPPRRGGAASVTKMLGSGLLVAARVLGWSAAPYEQVDGPRPRPWLQDGP